MKTAFKKIRSKIFVGYLFLRDFWQIEIVGKKFSPVTDKERELVKELRTTLASFKEDSAGKTWRKFSFRLRLYATYFDPRRFLRWHVIQQTMFITEAWPECVAALTADPEWNSVWKPVITEDQFGDPLPQPGFSLTSGNRLLHAYHLNQFQKATDADFSQLGTVVEFGGGYGNMCRLIRRLGFKGTYIIFDLPEFSALQKFYLSGVGENMKDTVLVSTPADLAAAIKKGQGKTLFIATWSLSESPLSVRNNIMPLVTESDYFLLAYQATFDGVDNVRYFKEIMNAHPTYQWTPAPIGHVPGAHYLFGKKI